VLCTNLLFIYAKRNTHLKAKCSKD
jgi:hypothetical protein